MKERINKFLNSSMNRGLSWTTIASEKLLLAIIGISTCVASAIYLYEMILAREILLGDLFMLFIYAEILAMVGAFYSTNRIPVTLPIIVAITALCRLIIMQTKDMDGLMVMWEAGAIFVLAGAAYLMSLKDKLSLEKLRQSDD
ncbi:phosphate-starvation-inducible PsiE family protein [Gammaproteobacteria bacterium]|jgi:protein PsiE|nr:phosphate-starvation-inducible PsiE family protein [Gammaproteobacteria bacterium]MEC8314363.1 phosphate-starvation-inducible PsiE family protein [Pseudomonadota bacterium]MEC8448660.1 phosphate-starvation-inducible PsiE family protein [Pseudomonadota bacterium]MEC8798723.1 phosphate-starvation-inducible PsiE family protein [Pseudomonadota bacterium]MED5349371.1 phosphate-starvation-inducible PsiE family protein [Pseudomonadota bacterium]|tara:strand:- start:841 stop:1269 length:429 start_codon:yes stop_codon:yes gene_type:complete